MEDLSYYGYKGYRLRDVNDENIWDVGAFGGVGHTVEVQGGGWGVGDQRFNCCEVFVDHFNYRHQVDDNKNRRHSPIKVERTWATNYWPDRCYA